MVGRAFESALALAVVVAASASAQVKAEAPPPGHKAPSSAVATVAGTPIALAEVDELNKRQDVASPTASCPAISTSAVSPLWTEWRPSLSPKT